MPGSRSTVKVRAPEKVLIFPSAAVTAPPAAFFRRGPVKAADPPDFSLTVMEGAADIQGMGTAGKIAVDRGR